MQCFGDTQRFSGASTIVNVPGTHRGIPHPLPHPCCTPSSWRRGSEWELSLPPLPGKSVTRVCSPPYTNECGMSPGRRRGAPGVPLLPCSLPAAELPQALALPPQSLPFPEQLLWDGSAPGRCCCFVPLGAGGVTWELEGCARASLATAAFPCLPCRGCDPLLLLCHHSHLTEPARHLGKGQAKAWVCAVDAGQGTAHLSRGRQHW